MLFFHTLPALSRVRRTRSNRTAHCTSGVGSFGTRVYASAPPSRTCDLFIDIPDLKPNIDPLKTAFSIFPLSRLWIVGDTSHVPTGFSKYYSPFIFCMLVFCPIDSYRHFYFVFIFWFWGCCSMCVYDTQTLAFLTITRTRKNNIFLIISG